MKPDTHLVSCQRGLRIFSMLILIILISACGRKEISERPPVDTSVTSAPFITQPSTVGAVVVIPLAQIIQAANESLPRTYDHDWADGEDLCVNLGKLFGKNCTGTKYKYTVNRGEITISPVAANALKLSLDVSVDGQGGFRGYLPKLLQADAKKFDAAAKVDIVLAPKVGSDWCPTVEVTPSYNWIKNPRVEIVSGVDVGVSELVNKALNNKMPQIALAVQKSINCAEFKTQLASLYSTRSFPVELVPGQKTYVNVEPLDFALSEFKVDTQAIQLAALLTAKLEVSETPVAPSQIPLPRLKTVEDGPAPRIALVVPLRTPISLLQAEAQKRIGGKSFEGETLAGRVKVTIGKVDIYRTSGGRIAIGLDIDAKLPGKLLDTKGVIYVVGTPATDGKSEFRLVAPTFTRILDNDAWNALSALLDSKIRGELDKNLRYNFAGDIEKVKTGLSERLSDPKITRDVHARVSDVDISLRHAAINGTDLVVEVFIGAGVTVEPNLASLVAQR